MNCWRHRLALYTVTFFALLSFSSRPAAAAGLSYREILHFYVRDGKPAINQPPLSIADYNAHPSEQAASLDFSADGKTLAVGYQGNVRFWNITTGTLQSELRLNAAPPNQNQSEPPNFRSGTRVRYSPDGNFLAISVSNELQIYQQGALVQRCIGFTDAPFSWSPDSKMIAGGNTDGDLVLCDARTGETRNIEGFLATAAEWNPDGKYIAVLSDKYNFENYLRLFNVQTNAIETTVKGYYSVSWHPDGSEFISPINTMRIHNTQTGLTRINVEGNSYALAWHPNGQRIASLYGNITISAADTGRNLASIPLELNTTFAAPFSQHRWLSWNRDGSQLAAIDTFGAVHIWEESGTPPPAPIPTNTPRPQPTAVPQMTLVAPPTLVALPTLANTAGSRLPSKIVQQKPDTTSFHWTEYRPERPPYRFGSFTLDFDAANNLWVLSQAGNAQKRFILSNLYVDISQPSWSPDGHYLAYVQDAATVRIFDLQTFQLVGVLRHQESIAKILWHPTLPLVATLSQDSQIGLNPMLIVYNVQTHQDVYAKPIDPGLGSGIAWTDNTQTLLVWGADVGVFFLDLQTWAQTVTWKDESVLIGALSPDKRYFAFVYFNPNDPTLYFLDTQSKSIVLKLPHTGEIFQVEWRPDGQQLATLNNNDTLTIWGN